MNLTGLDLLIGGVIFISLLVGVFRGFIREVLSLVSWGLALWVGWRFFKPASAYLENMVSSEPVRQIAAFVFLFIAVLILLTVASHFLSKLFKVTGIAFIDRLFGALFGFGRGVLIMSIVVILGGATALPKESWWKDSVLAPQLQPVTDFLLGLMPDKVSGKFQADTSAQISAKKPETDKNAAPVTSPETVKTPEPAKPEK